MAAALVESLGLMDVRHLMSGLTVPTLVLHREGDVIPAADARAVAAGIPGAKLTILPGTDHLPWVGDWAPVIAEILAFVVRSRPARPGRAADDGSPRGRRHGPGLRGAGRAGRRRRGHRGPRSAGRR